MSQRGQTHWAHAGQHQDLTMCHLPTNSREAIAFPSAFLPWVFYNSWLECKYFRQSQNDKRKGNESNKKLTDHGKLTMTFDLARMQWFALVCNSTIHHTNHSRQWFHQVAIQSLLTLIMSQLTNRSSHGLQLPSESHGVLPIGFSTFQSPKATLPFQGELQQRCEWVQLLLQTAIQTAIFMHLQPSAIFSAAIFISIFSPFNSISLERTATYRTYLHSVLKAKGDRATEILGKMKACCRWKWNCRILQAMLEELDFLNVWWSSLTLVVWRQEWQAGTVQVRSQA